MSNHQIHPGDTDRIDQLKYEPVSPKYRNVQIACATIAYVSLAGVALLLLLADGPWWCIGAEAAIVISFVVNLFILRKAYKYKGFAMREHDITWRSGIIFPKTTTIPFSRIQQVSISQNPVSRYFRMCSVDIVNGAQGLSSLNIQGLPKEKAEELKNVITQRIQL